MQNCKLWLSVVFALVIGCSGFRQAPEERMPKPTGSESPRLRPMASPRGPVVYEVSISVDRSIEAEFVVWMRGHVEEMLEIDGFEGVEILRQEADSGSERVTFVGQYRLRDRQALQEYFDHRAARMRADGPRRFPGKFSISRRVLFPYLGSS